MCQSAQRDSEWRYWGKVAWWQREHENAFLSRYEDKQNLKKQRTRSGKSAAQSSSTLVRKSEQEK